VLKDVIPPADPFTGHQGWVGCHAVENTQLLGFTDLIQIRGVKEKLH
jgi:hypothetical protein